MDEESLQERVAELEKRVAERKARSLAITGLRTSLVFAETIQGR